VPRAAFLARRSYRRRRLIDAARMLPLFGAVGLALPLLWQSGDPADAAGGGGAARTGLLLFGLWFALIGAAALIARLLRVLPGDEREPE